MLKARAIVLVFRCQEAIVKKSHHTQYYEVQTIS